MTGTRSATWYAVAAFLVHALVAIGAFAIQNLPLDSPMNTLYGRELLDVVDTPVLPAIRSLNRPGLPLSANWFSSVRTADAVLGTLASAVIGGAFYAGVAAAISLFVRYLRGRIRAR